MNNTVVEILNPIATSGTYNYAENPLVGGTCYIQCGFRTNFSQTNPTYTSPIFLSYYPEFSSILDGSESNSQYMQLFDTFCNMANNCLDYRRFGGSWQFLMSSFIAHYLALTLGRLYAINTNASGGVPQLLGALANQSTGLAVKESLGGEEIQTEQMINVGLYKDAGEYMMTPYGRAFWNMYISYAKLFVRGVY